MQCGTVLGPITYILHEVAAAGEGMGVVDLNLWAQICTALSYR